MNKIIVFLLLSLFAIKAEAKYLIANLSTNNIIKNQEFQGTEIVISGVADSNSNIVITAVGPYAKYRVWKKTKQYGIWMNHKSMKISGIPSFYFIATTYDDRQFIDSVATGYEPNFIAHPSLYIKERLSDPNFMLFWDNFYQYKQRSNMYQMYPKKVESIGSNIFRTTIFIPENAATGVYNVKVYKVVDGALEDNVVLKFYIEKATLDEEIDTLSRERPLHYGAIAVLIALTAGAIAGYLFRNDR